MSNIVWTKITIRTVRFNLYVLPAEIARQGIVLCNALQINILIFAGHRKSQTEFHISLGAGDPARA